MPRFAVLPLRLDGEVVDLLDRVGVPQPGRLLRGALVVLLARLELIEDESP